MNKENIKIEENLDIDINDKKYELMEYFKMGLVENVLIIAFSGGVDSALLLEAAIESRLALGEGGKKVYAFTFQSELNTRTDLKDAVDFANRYEKKGIGKDKFEHIIIHLNEIEEAGIENNPEDRCYLCKKNLFLKLKEAGKQVGGAWVVEGTNIDDLKEYRPGLKAIEELGVESPLMKLGLSKRQIRAMAKTFGLEVYRKPSTPCMATRIPYGDQLNLVTLEKIALGEEYLREIFDGNVRIRLHNKVARIEIDQKNMIKAIEERNKIVEKLKEIGFEYITLDLEGFRSGSMDI